MPERNENRHMIDILFVLTLFCVFALCALTLVTLGANIYEGTVNHMESNYESRTPVSYITQKIRQADREDSVYVTDLEGTDALLLKQTIQNQLYYTYLYEYEGYLYELFSRADLEFSPSAGNRILPVQSFHVSKTSSKLISVNLTTSEGEDLHISLSTHCRNEETP